MIIVSKRPLWQRPIYGFAMGGAGLLDGLVQILSLGFLSTSLPMRMAAILMHWQVRRMERGESQ